MAKVKTIRARIERRHEQWMDKEKARTGENEGEILRVLIDREINKCNAPEFLAIREASNEKQN